MSLIDKILSKEIMKLMKFRNKFLKVRMEENKKGMSTAKLMFYFYETRKKEYFDNLNKYFDNLKDVNDNKTFWKTVKPFLSNKIVLKNISH